MMTLPVTLCMAVLSCLISSANAQIVYRRRRTSLGRVIAGAVVGGVCGILLLCFLCMLMKRRRRARTNPGQGNPSGFMAKPLFGGPFGRQQQQQPHNNQTMSQPPQHQGNPYWNGNTQPINNDPNAPPPQYGPPTTGGPKDNNTQQFAPPPGPPPQAHVKGDDRNSGQNFVGGFQPHAGN